MMSAHSLDSPFDEALVHCDAARGDSSQETLSEPRLAAASDAGAGAAPSSRRGGSPALVCGEYAADMVIAQKYRLVRVLCQGGMGAVWVAHNELLDVQVALKLIRHDLRTPGLAERLMTEARLAARLEHPSVVSVFDVGNTERGDPYIVMELLKGEDLRDVLERETALDPIRSVQCLLPIAEGLSAAHARGIVHRDLKPENVYFTRIEGRIQPKIVDFGIAKPTGNENQRSVTRSGAVVGSPDYMSPEQARGLDDVDHRADIWAFAVVLYECVTGRPPFADSSYEALLRDVVEKPVVPITERGIDEPELWAILERAFAKDRNERWQTVREMAVALAHWLRARGVEEDVCGQSLRATWLRDSDPPRDAMSSTPLLLIPKQPPAPSFAAAPTPERSSSGRRVVTPILQTPVSATLRGDADAGKRPAVSPLPRRVRRRGLVGAMALGAAFAVWGIVGTLVAGVGTAAASAPSDQLAASLESTILRLRAAVQEMEPVPTPPSVSHASVGQTASPVDEPLLLAPPPERPVRGTLTRHVTSSAPLPNAPPAQASAAPRAAAAESAPVAPATPRADRNSPRRWAPFVEQDLGF